MADCTKELCDYCLKSQHVSGEFPLLSGPKPVVNIFGVCCQELMFFESPDVAPSTHVMEGSFPGVVRVTNGFMMEAQIVQQLCELAPGNFQWNLVKLENQTYKVEFPTKEDQLHTLKFAMCRVPSTNIIMEFDEWK